ncbi:hypothetical protein STEG23_019809, partial [Scotinomys teguina]
PKSEPQAGPQPPMESPVSALRTRINFSSLGAHSGSLTIITFSCSSPAGPGVLRALQRTTEIGSLSGNMQKSNEDIGLFGSHRSQLPCQPRVADGTFLVDLQITEKSSPPGAALTYPITLPEPCGGSAQGTEDGGFDSPTHKPSQATRPEAYASQMGETGLWNIKAKILQLISTGSGFEPEQSGCRSCTQTEWEAATVSISVGNLRLISEHEVSWCGFEHYRAFRRYFLGEVKVCVCTSLTHKYARQLYLQYPKTGNKSNTQTAEPLQLPLLSSWSPSDLKPP